MEDKQKDKKTVKLEGGVEISQKAFEKIRKEVIDDYTKDMVCNVVKRDFQCFDCKKMPRPGQITFKKCKPCSKIFCGNCGSHRSHQCADGSQRYPEMSIQLKINLDLDFLPYFCKNNKFGCQELLSKKAELFEHEYVCEFQLTYCADSLCKSEVNLLNYLDHYKEKHVSHDDLGIGKTFKLPLLMNQIQSQTLQVILRNDLLTLREPCQGTYQLANSVNGKPSWINNSHAIWYRDEGKNNLIIGQKGALGTAVAIFYAPNTSGGPDNCSNTWKYYDDEGKK